MQSASEAFFLSNAVFVRPQPVKLEYRDTQVSGTHEVILHSETGPALVFEDGYKQYIINGVRVPPVVVENPSLISLPMIDGERNVEVRRVMIEKYGLARYIQDSGAEILDSDAFGTLHRKTQPNDDPIHLLEVKNSTVESDGSRKTYFLRVPPELTSARAAVAWTFGLEADDYGPIVET
ncbi:hypothetical protein KF728_07160 [Candidatus Obscuribacterales bacterium]|nr:hypothetical protein [Candidatus Obscuribacterales bacterium]